MRLLRTETVTEVRIHPDGMHGKQFDFSGWLSHQGFETVGFLMANPSPGRQVTVVPYTPQTLSRGSPLGDVMNADFKRSDGAVEVDFSSELGVVLSDIDFNGTEKVVVHVPLPSFGCSNSYIDLCSDLLDASWALETLAVNASSIEITVGSGYFKPNITAVLRGLRPGLRASLEECALVFTEENLEPHQSDRLGELRSRINDYEDELHLRSPRLPDIVDWYFTNLMMASAELRSEAPDAYRDQLERFPERQVGFFRSAHSTALGGECYASNCGWLIPEDVHVDRFFEATGQKYRLGEFINGDILTLGGRPVVMAEELVANFPMHRFLRSQICAGFAASKDSDVWDTGPFDWLEAPFLPTPVATDEFSHYHAGEDERIVHNTQCLVHQTGTLIILGDKSFKHLIYDTTLMNLAAVKRLHEHAVEATSRLSAAAGIAFSLSCNWASLSDEDFEQLCYDLIFLHPEYDSDTIRKLGKSRSRDGGRDIEIFEIPRQPMEKKRKWIFQCKLIKNGASLGATKLLDVGDMLEQHGAYGFGVLTSALIDATLYDKLDKICDHRNVKQRHMSVLELERALSRNPTIRDRYFNRC